MLKITNDRKPLFTKADLIKSDNWDLPNIMRNSHFFADPNDAKADLQRNALVTNEADGMFNAHGEWMPTLAKPPMNTQLAAYEQEIAELKSKNTQLENACHGYNLQVGELIGLVREFDKLREVYDAEITRLNAELVDVRAVAEALLNDPLGTEKLPEPPRKPTFSGHVMSRTEVAGLLRDG